MLTMSTMMVPGPPMAAITPTHIPTTPPAHTAAKVIVNYTNNNTNNTTLSKPGM